MEILILLSALVWLAILLLPWRPWSTREEIEPGDITAARQPGNITVLLPARNEAETIQSTLQALARQGQNLKAILVDDQSSDDTVARARAEFGGDLAVVAGEALPPGWTGKLWALEQGRRHVETELILLLDADIELAPGMLAALAAKLRGQGLDLVSVMASLRMRTFWERLLLPAFIYFFKLLYPFALGNNPRSRLGVAAGGCILVRTAALEKIGAFRSLRDALIDDCTLAQMLKAAGGRTWIGLSHSVRSVRAYPGLAGIWNMVARSAFTQLRYSPALLLGTTVGMIGLFWLPLVGLCAASSAARLSAAAGFSALVATYVPTLRYYGRSPLWAVALPWIASLYLLMTWTSALRYWRGQGAQWKDRVYSSRGGTRNLRKK